MSSLLSRSQLGPLSPSTDCTSPQIPGWEVTIRANLIQPLASWATRRTFSSTIEKPSKKDIDLVLNGLMGGAVFAKLGYMTEEAVASSCDYVCINVTLALRAQFSRCYRSRTTGTI